ncbi:MAG: hypothetical protein R3A79_26005 [Nannocystaceae bacterium]
MAPSRTQLLSLAALTLGTQVLSLLAACRTEVTQRGGEQAVAASTPTPTPTPSSIQGDVAAAPVGEPAAPVGAALEPEPAAVAEPAVAAFFASELTYCDAVVLAQHWRTTPGEAKAKAGALLVGDRPQLDDALRSARAAVRDPSALCPFHESDYSYEDAVALAEYWECGVIEAKARVERKLAWGDGDVVKESLAEARGADHREEGGRAGDDDAMLDLFWGARYTACDAEVMASHWEMDVMDAKVFAGQKIDAGNRSVVDDRLRAARSALYPRRDALCPFHTSGYAYADAELLAAVWETDVGEAKARVTHKLFWGDSAVIDEALAEGRAPKRIGRTPPQ